MSYPEKWSRTLWFLSLILIYSYFYFMLERVVEPVPVHFDWSGLPNGWLSKTDFTWFFSLFIGGMNLLLVFIIPLLIKKLPLKLINIPNKDYWLKTEHMRKETYSKIWAITDSSCLFLNLIMFFSLDLILENSTGESLFQQHMLAMGVLSVLFLAALFVWTRKFWKVPG